MPRPLLLLTIDVEEDMPGWEITDPITTENVSALPELAAMCRDLGVRPTYLCAYPVATQDRSADVLRRLSQEDGCELGTHMHAWNTPPFRGVPGRSGDERSIPYYQRELEASVFREKLEVLHAAVGALAGREPTSHRAGRYGIDHRTMHELQAFGYQVDTSITPLAEHTADGGPDFRRAPQKPYRPAADDVLRNGDVAMVEVPVSIGLTRRLPDFVKRAYVTLPSKLRLRGLLSSDYTGLVDYAWLYPVRFELEPMKRAARVLVDDGNPVLNVFLHSSELVPGASGRIETADDVAEVRTRLRALLAFCLEELNAVPATLTEAGRELAPRLGLDFRAKRSG